MKELVLNGKNTLSKIMIGRSLFADAASLSLGICKSDKTTIKVCIITDSKVAGIYLDNLVNQYEKEGINPVIHVVSEGEEYKTLKTIEEIYGKMADNHIGRDDMVVALGGGVVGDMAGYAAATYQRGVKNLIQIPTTLLAQVDSSVGGKCGVDLPQGKNLVGAFRQPNLVIVDPELLKTLANQVFVSGMAEVIKYGCILEPEIISIIENDDYLEKIDQLITRCIELKIQVVEEDETENGVRRILNFGHTIGHGAEKLGNYTELSHGEAVAIGINGALLIGEKLGITKQGNRERILNIINKLGLPTEIKYDKEKIYEAMLSDKKRQGDKIAFIFISEIGKYEIRNIPADELLIYVKGLGA